MNEPRRGIRIGAVALFVVLHIAASVYVNRRAAWGDEAHFYETVKYFSQGVTLHTLKHYPEMSGPLPFVLYAGWGRLAGDSLQSLRMLSPAIAMLTYLITFAWMWRYTQSEFVAGGLTLLTALNPYMLGLSVFVFTDMLTMLFLAIGLLALERRNAWLLFVGACGALLCRQYLVFFTAGAALYLALRYFECRLRAELWQLAALVAAHAPLAGLVWLWQGPCPDSWLRGLYLPEPLGFHPTALTLYLALGPISILPLLWLSRKSIYHWRSLGSATLVGVAWYAAFPVTVSPSALEGNWQTVGFVHRALVTVGDQPLAHVVFCVSLCLALPLLACVARQTYQLWSAGASNRGVAFAVVLATFFAIQPCSYLAWEKYFMPAVPLLSICCWQLHNRWGAVGSQPISKPKADADLYARAA